MAETPFTPGSPEDPTAAPAVSPEPAEPAGQEPAPEEPVLAVEEAVLAVEEEPVVEGWSGTPVAASAEEAIARPEAGGGPIEINISPPPTEPPVAAAPEPEPAPAPAPVPQPIAAPAPEPEPEPVAAPAPEPEPIAAAPAPEPTPEPMPELEPIPVAPPAPAPVAAAEPTVATTLEVPPLPGAEAGEGGEFDLLMGKLRSWLDQADLGGNWQKLRGPLKGVALLVVAILALRLYARVVGTLDSIPLISGLLELTGLIYLVWFSTTRLVRTSERERVLADWKRRWQAFSGRD